MLKYSYAPFCANLSGPAQALFLLFHPAGRFQPKAIAGPLLMQWRRTVAKAGGSSWQ